jgi:hypothetical protein
MANKRTTGGDERELQPGLWQEKAKLAHGKKEHGAGRKNNR